MSEEAPTDEPPVQSAILNGWFSELIQICCPGQSFCLKVRDVLFHEKSDYQDIMILKSETYGNVLILDGIINCTERDEFSYQEMLTNLALCSHPNPESVLIIGGGDGGIAREVAKHDVVKRIVQCEIDQKVIDACKKFLPSMAVGFDDPKMDLIVGDGFAFLEKHQNEFDVIITDSSDPIGPAIVLFQKEYYALLKRALKSDGILISQAESLWLPIVAAPVISLIGDIKTLFPVVGYAYTQIPTYTTGQIGFILASKNNNAKFEEPLRVLTDEEKDRMQLRYYNEHIHKASFCLPQFLKKLL